MSDRYIEISGLDSLVQAMLNEGAIRLFFKSLVRNNNDKQQIYVATDMAKIGFIPTKEVVAERSRSTKAHPNGKAIFRSSVPLYWLSSDGRTCPASGTKLIYYPQYPEVRLSGFLEGCEFAPNELLSRDKRGKERGRILFLGVTADGRVIGHVVSPESEIAKEIGDTDFPVSHGALKEILFGDEDNSRKLLLSRLAKIHHAGWVDSVKLTHSGMAPYEARNGIGYTLEAHLGVMPNGDAEPDFHGWEVKASTVKEFHRSMSVRVSVLTCNPTGGLIHDIGWRSFVERFGYRNPEKPAGRIDFNGNHKYGVANEKTSLILDIHGYKDGEITDEHGGVVIKDEAGQIILMWHFSKFLDHWKRKHSNAVFVPGLARSDPNRQYWYGRKVKLASGTDFFRVLDAIQAGHVVYDPGLWVNPEATTPKERGHQRHQIRVVPSKIGSLYREFEEADTLE